MHTSTDKNVAQDKHGNKFASFCKVTISIMFHGWVEQVVFFCVLVRGKFRNEVQMPWSKYPRWRKKKFTSSLNICSVKRGRGRRSKTPPLPAISQLIRGCFIERRRNRYSPPRCFLHAKGSIRETIERGGPCWLLMKLGWMGTQRVQMKGVPPR